MHEINPSIFKAYDIRGVYPQEIHEDAAYRIAQAYAKFFSPKAVALGRDVRLSGPALFESAKQGFLDHGVNVVDIGVVSTDMLYFAVAHYGYDGGFAITASHNPREYNGVKMVRAHGAPISGDSGIMDMRDIVLSDYSQQAATPGTYSQKDIFEDYIQKVLSIIDRTKIRPLKVVANCNFGTSGRVVKRLAEFLPITVMYLNEQQDGSFPKGRPDPLVPENRGETIELIKQVKPDLGVAWDSDADRTFFFDENGRFLSGYFTTALLAEYLLKKYPGGKVITDMKLNWAIIDTVTRNGGMALPNKTGNSFFKERMIREDAVFGGEISSHFYFRDFFYYLDNGIIPFLLILDILSTSGKTLSQIYDPYFEKYFAIEETNSEVADVARVLAILKERYRDGKLSEIDGVAIEYPDWRFNVRTSNTEPLVRLNLEARNPELMKQKTEEVLAIIRG